MEREILAEFSCKLVVAAVFIAYRMISLTFTLKSTYENLPGVLGWNERTN